MTHEDFNKLQTELFDDILKMAKTKGVEYASDKNERLANFKRLAVELEISASKVCYIFFKKHLDAIITYLKDGRVYSEEGIRGRFVDAINYLTLEYGLIVDEMKSAENEKQESTTSPLPIHKLSDIIEKGVFPHDAIPSVCPLCNKNIYFGEGYIKFYSGHYVHDRCYKRHENEKTQETRTPEENKSLDTGNTR